MQDEVKSFLIEKDHTGLLNLYKRSNQDQKDKIIKFLLHRNYNKVLWHEAVIFLRSISSTELIRYVSDLLSWLEDMNWPGSENVVKILSEFPVEVFVKPLNDEIRRAVEDPDDLWLGGIKILCNEKEELIPIIEKMNKEELDKVEWVAWQST